VDIWDGLRIVLKRWKVALPIFLLFAVIAVVGSGMINAEYSATGSVILLGPNSQASESADAAAGDTDVNPYIIGCNTCETVARAIQVSMSSTETKQSMADDGLSTDYTIVVENRSPLMTLTADSGSPQNAVDTLAGVIDRINGELELRQSDVNAPSDQRITANVLSQDAQAKGDYGGRSKARVALLAAGALTAVATVLVMEGFSFARRGRVDDYDDYDDYDGGGYDGGGYDDADENDPRGGAHVARHSPRPTAPVGNGNGYGYESGLEAGGWPDNPVTPRA
jgi:capsular polysaccharide biosynthesis protein